MNNWRRRNGPVRISKNALRYSYTSVWPGLRMTWHDVKEPMNWIPSVPSSLCPRGSRYGFIRFTLSISIYTHHFGCSHQMDCVPQIFNNPLMEYNSTPFIYSEGCEMDEPDGVKCRTYSAMHPRRNVVSAKNVESLLVKFHPSMGSKQFSNRTSVFCS